MSMSHFLRPLPKGISDFQKLRMGNYVYVDKTETIYNLITSGQYYFLSRPRRFGKSLLISTFKALFEGKKELFEGLWIGSSNFQWKAHPVIHLSFFEIARGTAEKLEVALERRLQIIGHDFSINLDPKAPLEEKFATLIRKMSVKNPVVVLIDEYDHAILNNIKNHDAADECRKILQNFYGVLKDMDAYLHFVFLIGVTKFAQTSIFSGLNNLEDLTMSKRAATLLGYTHQELLGNFQDHIFAAAQELNQTPKEIVGQMTEWYDGYQFSDFAEIDNQLAKVYNPWSVLLFLSENKFKNYWFATGSPTFLFEVMKQQDFLPIELSGVTASANQLGTFQIDKISLPTLLYQTGYLTIESYDSERDNYHLALPNKEVKDSLFKQLLHSFTQAPDNRINNTLGDLNEALESCNIDLFCLTLQTFFAQIASHMHIKFERYYQSIIFVITKLAGFKVVGEDQTNLGRIDMVAQTSNTIFIMEFKTRGSAQQAFQQIENTKYAQKYLLSKKKIIFVGIFIDTKQRNLTEWVSKELADTFFD